MEASPDYYSLLTNAISALDQDTPETRQELFERAKKALGEQLRALGDDDAEIMREQRRLAAAISVMQAVCSQPKSPKPNETLKRPLDRDFTKERTAKAGDGQSTPTVSYWARLFRRLIVIEDRDHAMAIIRRASTGFLLLSGLGTVVSTWLLMSFPTDVFEAKVLFFGMICSSLLVMGLSLLMRLWRSRFAATCILVLLVPGFALSTTAQLASLAGYPVKGSAAPVILGALLVWASIRATIATFKLHGRFATASSGPLKSLFIGGSTLALANSHH
jgi:hypothetical protein